MAIKLNVYTGETLRAEAEKPVKIVDKFIYEQDAIMLLGSEKAGKSILAQQMIVDIVTGSNFLGKYRCPKPRPVVYIQCEGKRTEFVQRLNNMCLLYKNFDDTKLLHIYKKFLPLNTPEYLQEVQRIITEHINTVWGESPALIVVDSVYKAMSGDLIDNKSCTDFTNALDQFIDIYKAAVVFVHHDAKAWRNQEKNEIDRGDQGSFGSVFFRAYVDHIIYLKMNRDKTRTLKCETTRSGNTGDVESLILVQPSPLLFQLQGKLKASAEVILRQLDVYKQLNYEQLMENTGLSLSSLKHSMSELISAKLVKSVGTKPKSFIRKR